MGLQCCSTIYVCALLTERCINKVCGINARAAYVYEHKNIYINNIRYIICCIILLYNCSVIENLETHSCHTCFVVDVKNRRDVVDAVFIHIKYNIIFSQHVILRIRIYIYIYIIVV